MKLKTLALSISALAVVTAAVLWFDRPRDPSVHEDPRVGQPLVGTDILRDLDTLVLRADGTDAVTLRRDETRGWTVAEVHDFPVDFPKLSRLVESLREAEIRRFVTRQPVRLERLDLGGHGLRLDAGDTGSLEGTFGRTSDDGGVYFRFADEDAAYLLSNNPRLDTNADAWARKTFLEVEAEEVQSIRFIWPDDRHPPLLAARESADAPFAADPAPEGKVLNPERVTRFLDTLKTTRFNRTVERDVPEARDARPYRRGYELTLFDGSRLAFAVGRTPEHEVPAWAREDGALDWTAEDNADDEPEAIPAGPVVVWLEDVPEDSPWAGPATRRAFIVGDFVHGRQPAYDQLLDGVPEAEEEEDGDEEDGEEE
ncbi:MAG: DUF4340 domain-containing protein [Opitutales bacterium]|nr:DUF4340 domain-containing protein [Opitutales bacterium]